MSFEDKTRELWHLQYYDIIQDLDTNFKSYKLFSVFIFYINTALLYSNTTFVLNSCRILIIIMIIFIIIIERMRKKALNIIEKGTSNFSDLANFRDIQSLDMGLQIQGGHDICTTWRMSKFPWVRVDGN